MEELTKLVATLGGLGGFAALVAMIVNALKCFAKLPDGSAGTVALALNLAGVVGLFIGGLFKIDLPAVDGVLKSIAEVGTAVLALMIQLKISLGTHNTLSTAEVPIIGASHNRGKLIIEGD